MVPGRHLCAMLRCWPGPAQVAPGVRVPVDYLDQAVQAFQRNGFILLVDDRQLTDLEEEVVLKPGSQVTFLRLIPLVGG